MRLNYIPGGVTAPAGFRAAGAACGVKKNGKDDVALLLSDVPCAGAGVFTRNLVKAAPIYVCRDHLRDGRLQGVVVNSGNANACAPNGKENALRMTQAAAQATGLRPEDFGVASTGVIGVPLPIDLVEGGIAQAAQALSPTGSDAAAQAILTSDTRKKEVAVALEIDGVPIRVGAMAKGSGMIHPNMGTTLSFVTTDCAVPSDLLQELLTKAVSKTFNRITVDGDTSTNDTCLLLANGQAGNPPLTRGTPACEAFYQALLAVCANCAKAVAADGEGASRLLTVTVSGAATEDHAETLARAIAASSLVKTALFGADANWGRVLCAMGYAGVPFDPDTVDVTFGSRAGEVTVCRGGVGLPFDEAQAKHILSQPEVSIRVRLPHGPAAATCWGCDLTYDYVKINGDYRS